jgi:hypothetical protein
MQITTIGLDIAKNVFQVHGIDATEKVVVRKQLSARPGDEVFYGTAALPGWHGGVCYGALLGETVETVDRKTRLGSREQRTRENVWDRSADHIRASGHNGCVQRPDT